MATARLHAIPESNQLVELYAESPLPTRHGLLKALVFVKATLSFILSDVRSAGPVALSGAE